MATRADRKAKPRTVKVPLTHQPASGASQESSFDLEAIRTRYALSRPTLARMLGLSEETETRLEKGEIPVPDETVRDRFDRLKAILQKAAGVMQLDYIPTWVENPSPACAEIGARAPVDLMERGDYEAVEDLLFFLGSGVPY